MKLEIKVVRPEERNRDFYADVAPFFMSEKVKKEMPYLRDTENRVWFFCLKEGVVVGIAAMERRKKTTTLDEHCYLGALYVLPEHRGSGVGRALIEARMSQVPPSLDVRTVCVPELSSVYSRRGFSAVFQRGKYTHMKKKGDG
jgi:GNAT superfamily N-acetyltransferase